MSMRARIRYMVPEAVNHWPNAASDFDEKQKQMTVNLDTHLLPGESGYRITVKGLTLLVEKVILSNDRRPDGVEAFVQAKLVRK